MHPAFALIGRPSPEEFTHVCCHRAGLRYYVTQTATVYTKNIELVRAMNTQIAELGKQGVCDGGGYQSTDYQFSGLNALKPQMIEEATVEYYLAD